MWSGRFDTVFGAKIHCVEGGAAQGRGAEGKHMRTACLSNLRVLAYKEASLHLLQRCELK